MNLFMALEKAVEGYKVRRADMQPGAYIYYNFDGWRIQFTNNGVLGSSSGWRWTEEDEAAEWEVTDPEIRAGDCWDVNLVQNVISEDEPFSIDKPVEGWPMYAKDGH